MTNNMTLNCPLVSIAIITYNQREFLRECIDSCLAQDYPRFEIVVADDCSRDGTQSMLHEYDSRYPGVFVLKFSDENQGITRNSNVAHFACSGKYIVWMGGDDLMLPGKLSRQINFMESNPSCTISYHNLSVFESSTREELFRFNENSRISGDIRTSIRRGTFNGACSTAVRARMTPAHGFDVRIGKASDWLYWIETLSNGGTIDYIDEVLGRYRRHPGNTTRPDRAVTQCELDHLNTCNTIISKYPEHMFDAMCAYARILFGLRHKIPYRAALWTSIRIYPDAKAVVALGVYFLTLGKVRL